jgi:hypothetical protein
MRGWLVRVFAREDEIGQVAQSHDGDKVHEMIRGITAHHDTIREVNPQWVLDLLEQLPNTRPMGSGVDIDAVGAGINASEVTLGAPAAGVTALAPSQIPLSPVCDGGTAVHLPELQAIAHRLCPWWI